MIISIGRRRMPLICYLIVLVGSLFIAITVYTLVMFGWCGAGFRLPHPSSARAPEVAATTENSSLSPYLAATFKYTKGIEKPEGRLESDQCVVCLSGFKDGENVCQLPRCKHFYHAPCIDMWLYSHSECPVCRSPVDRMDHLKEGLATEENSREVLLDIVTMNQSL